jgi:hypothetical protein
VRRFITFIVTSCAIWACEGSRDNGQEQRTEPASDSSAATEGSAQKCAGFNPLKNVYFGDLHNHTMNSLDAYHFGNRTDPAHDYAFARGAPVYIDGAAGSKGGPWTTIDEKLDFVAVTDHSEWLNPGDPGTPPGWPMNAWADDQYATNTAYDPCNFTTFNAYEWTYMDRLTGANHHHNIIFKDDKVTPQTIDSRNYPGMLTMWQELDAECMQYGCTALTIPHNSNESQGTAFDFEAQEVAYMEKYQRLVEIYQHKGNSECLDDPQDQDAYCNFEIVSKTASPSNARGYVRPALERGIAYYQANKTNPLKLGFIGSTDNHNATPGNVGESDWPGYIAGNDNTPTKRLQSYPDFSPGAVAAVWAEENTRESIFGGLQRRESYATSGPHLAVRLYQYWGSMSDPCADTGFPAQLVENGAVPMGGTMSPPPSSGGPVFVVNAAPDATPLARIDIVKLHYDALTGRARERVVPLDVSDGFCVSWQDPDFNPNAASAYYARVYEQPTWRWSHYDCLAAPDADPAGCAQGGALDVQIQERAWTSPIFYEP